MIKLTDWNLYPNMRFELYVPVDKVSEKSRLERGCSANNSKHAPAINICNVSVPPHIN